METFEILCGIAAIIVVFYYYFTSTFNFWSSRGVRGPRPIPVFGTYKDVILGKKCANHYSMEVYNEFKDEIFIGIFDKRTPILIVKDLDLIQDILIKDFLKFPDRGIIRTIHEKAEPWSASLLHLEFRRWRPIRTKLSPAFSPSKLKKMFSLILECSNRLKQYTEELVNRNEPIECCDLMAKYTTEVIGTCGFGIDMNSLSDVDSEFRRMGRMMFYSPWRVIRDSLRNNVPLFYDILSSIVPLAEFVEFIRNLILKSIDYRDKNNVSRQDFVDALRELKKQSKEMGDIEITETLLISQAYIFFAAGFETSSMALSHALYELALNQKIQDKLREEIDQKYATHGSNLKDKNIKKMEYLDKVVKETLRKYPVIAFLPRKSVSNYTFKGTNVSIPKNLNIWIPMYSIHRDSRFYPDPEVFDPERFSKEIKQTRHPMTFLPFGDGPRNCIGLNFAFYQVKVGLITILRNFKVEPCEKTPIPYVINPITFLSAPKSGIHLRFTKVNRA
nr:PREDICTED: cytochrome P450 6j1-like [Linepithema humile]